MVLPGVLAGALPCAGASALRTQLSILLTACDNPAEARGGGTAPPPPFPAPGAPPQSLLRSRV